MSENAKHTYALITVKNPAFGQMDIRVSRDIPLTELIRNLFVALNCSQDNLSGYYAKSARRRALLNPGDTLRDANVFDGDIITIL
ncbi:MAG: EsaB/YukD family protein [Peptococcaceae bacterium]|nr:EsaB/YukD family protein [Peptococcaceae bacterium]